VGAGFIAGIHAGILQRDDRVTIAAVHDPDERAAAVFSAKTDGRVCPFIDDLLGSVDAVYICSPNALHAATAVRALDANIHVFSEKPTATSLADAQAVLDASARSRGVYQAGFNRRFAPVYKALKQRLVSGELAADSALLKMNRGDLRKPAWTGDAAISGGFLFETPVHMLDMARHLFGEPAQIICRGRDTHYDQLDDFSMLFTFASGMTAVMMTNAHATWLAPFERVEVYGDHAMAATEEMERIAFARGADVQTLDFAQLPLEERWGYAEEDARFIDAVHGTGTPAVTAADAFGTTALVERCYEAARLT
jgi:myo-inositol 2-dehydrogenase/D-chiro-inositol 1-dehydrogenase